MRKPVGHYVGVNRHLLDDIIKLKQRGIGSLGIMHRLRDRADPRVSVLDTIKYLEKQYNVPWSRSGRVITQFSSTPQDVWEETEAYRYRGYQVVRDH